MNPFSQLKPIRPQQQKMKPKNMITLRLRKSISRSPLRLGFIFISMTLACFALLPTTRGVSPPPDGGYANNNTAEGDYALFNLTTGADNTAIGRNALGYNTTGNSNTATGSQALLLNTTGSLNTAHGFAALYVNTTGYENAATGANALFSNTTGYYNTATGFDALYRNTTGYRDTATGMQALFYNTTGTDNTATGIQALYYNTTGTDNTATGDSALFDNTGSENTATGSGALTSNTTGNNNTAAGAFSLFSNNTGVDNTAHGNEALFINTIGNSNTADGNNALHNNTSGNSNIAVGDSAGINLTTGSNNIDIGHKGIAGEANTIRIGTVGTQTKTFIAGISGKTVASGVGVIVGSSGQLGTVVSSARFKDAIKPMDKASEAILALQPVTFHYKKELDPEGIPQFGLVAEEVEKVNPDLVARDEQGKPYTVRYEAVNAMLLNEFLKEHGRVQAQQSKIEKQEATITELRSAVAQQQKDFQATAAHQQKQIEALTATVQKVSAQVEMSRPAPQTVVDNH
jgi:hypothetical protein